MKVILPLLAVALFSACDSKNDGTPDTTQDPSTDVVVDTTADMGEEAATDVPDDTVDDMDVVDSAGGDTTPDADEDADASADVPEDGVRSTDDLSGGDGDSCDEAFIVDGVPFHVTGDSFDAGGLHAVGPDSCEGLTLGGGDGVEEVFSFTPETTASYHVRVRTTIWLTVTYVVTDCADTDGTCMGGTNRTNDQWLDLELEAGTTYYIIVDSPMTSGSGTYDLEITIP